MKLKGDCSLGALRSAGIALPLLAGLVMLQASSGAVAAADKEKRSQLIRKDSRLGSGKQLGSGPALPPAKKTAPEKAAATPKAPPPSALTPKPGSVMAPGPALTPAKQPVPVKVEPETKTVPPSALSPNPGGPMAPGPALTPVKQPPPVSAVPQAPKPVDLKSSAILGGKQLGSVTLAAKPEAEMLTAAIAKEAFPYAVLSRAVYESGMETVYFSDGQPEWTIYGDGDFRPKVEQKRILVENIAPDSPLRNGQLGNLDIPAEVEMGLHARAYKSADGKKIIVAFEGSIAVNGKNLLSAEVYNDWVKTNIPQVFGSVPDQYKEANK